MALVSCHGTGGAAVPLVEQDMHIEFIVRGWRSGTTEALREHVVHRLLSAVRRFEHRVHHMTVRLVDVNGPRRGGDSRCSVTVDVDEGRPVFVEATAASPFTAIALAALRLTGALRRIGGRYGAPPRGPVGASLAS